MNHGFVQSVASHLLKPAQLSAMAQPLVNTGVYRTSDKHAAHHGCTSQLLQRALPLHPMDWPLSCCACAAGPVDGGPGGTLPRVESALQVLVPLEPGGRLPPHTMQSAPPASMRPSVVFNRRSLLQSVRVNQRMVGACVHEWVLPQGSRIPLGCRRTTCASN